MATLTPPKQEKAEKKAPAKGKRNFEALWTELEKRMAWRIQEEEVHNPDIAIANVPYAWQDYDNRHAAAFREKHRLAELVAGAADDWEAILRLRNWAFRQIRHGTPSWPANASDPCTFIEAGQAGATFYCTYLAYTFVAAASALGYPARHLGIDRKRTPEELGTHHGVADVWVNKFRKWVHLDPDHDHHYELDGIPTSAWETGEAWRLGRADEVKTFVGVENRQVKRSRAGVRELPEAAHLYWHYIDAHNDVFNRTGRGWPDPVIFLVDEERKKDTWYQGQPPETYPHGRYKNGTFLTTERIADAYPDLNCTKLVLETAGMVSTIANVHFARTCVPNFSHHVAEVDGGPPVRIDGVYFPWRLHAGSNSIEIRAVNLAGHEGPPSRVRVQVTEDRSRKSEWPYPRGN